MAFRIIEGAYVNFEEIKEEFTKDYLESELTNPEIKKKYNLTKGEWKEFTYTVTLTQSSQYTETEATPTPTQRPGRRGY